jgi:tRNA pseudouridine55 synthase
MTNDRRAAGEPHGVLVVDKPSGPTSHDVVAQARRHFGTRRVGHAGTLDPMATGVLVLLFGEATKLSDVATGCDKKYFAELSFGRATDSHDADGNTTEERPETPGWVSEDRLHSGLLTERTRRLQLPPGISALKVDGQRAYRLSRAGTPPKLLPRPVLVHHLQLMAWSSRRASLELLVSKGYYVRALARDLAQALGVPAHLSQLRRLQSGTFTLAEACSWPPPVGQALLPLAEALPRLLPMLRLTESGVLRARRGQPRDAADFLDDPAGPGYGLPAAADPSVWAWTDPEGNPIALGRRSADGFRVQRGFAPLTGPE